MSAYMVSDETINKIMAYLVNEMYSNSHLYYWTIKEKHDYELETSEGREYLALKMFVLNKRGVEVRYGKDQAKEFRALDYQYKRMSPPTAIQAHKALACLLYQCTEGDLDESPFYKFLVEIKASIAETIIHSLPAYDLAIWG